MRLLSLGRGGGRGGGSSELLMFLSWNFKNSSFSL